MLTFPAEYKKSIDNLPNSHQTAGNFDQTSAVVLRVGNQPFY